MIIIAADDFGGLRHVTPGRADGGQVHHHRELRKALHHLGVSKIRTQKFEPRISQMFLNTVRIKVNTENAPVRALENRTQQVTTNKTTAANNSYGD